MIISDPVYGKVKLTDPVLQELINSPALLRLKKISQYGIPDAYYHLKNYSRYEHSVGVMLLLKRLGVGLEEQVAGLLHDVSHLTFSHVADWVFSSGSKGIEEHQNIIHKQFFQKTELPKILKKHGFDLNRILNEDNYPVLESLLPDLCADRVDYAIREFYYWLNPLIVKNCIDGIILSKNEIVFNSIQSAYLFATNYLKLHTRHWGAWETMMRYHLFAKVLKIAIDKGIIIKKDFYGEEEPIINKITKSKNIDIKKILKLMKKKPLPHLEPKINKKIIKKFRFVDPKILQNGKIIKLTSQKPEFKKQIEKFRKINQQGIIV